MARSKVARAQSRSKAGGETAKAERDVPPSSREFVRQQLHGVPTGEAYGYLDRVLEHAEQRIVESMPKLMGDIPRSQYPAFAAIDAIEAVREGLRLLGGVS